MPRKTWVYDPHSGGKVIPEVSQAKIRQRILAQASRHYAGEYERIDLRFRGRFCYIDCYKKPFVPEDYNPGMVRGIARGAHRTVAEYPDSPLPVTLLWERGPLVDGFLYLQQRKYEPCTFGNGSWEKLPRRLSTSRQRI